MCVWDHCPDGIPKSVKRLEYMYVFQFVCILLTLCGLKKIQKIFLKINKHVCCTIWKKIKDIPMIPMTFMPTRHDHCV